MKKCYEFYSSNAATEKLQQLVAELQRFDKQHGVVFRGIFFGSILQDCGEILEL